MISLAPFRLARPESCLAKFLSSPKNNFCANLSAKSLSANALLNTLLSPLLTASKANCVLALSKCVAIEPHPLTNPSPPRFVINLLAALSIPNFVAFIALPKNTPPNSCPAPNAPCLAISPN